MLYTLREVITLFKDSLKKLRKEKGLSQADFAEAFGVSRGAVAMWESGKRKPGFDTLEKLADFFGVTTDFILGIDNNSIRIEDIPGVIPFENFHKIPILGTIAAGIPILAEENHIGYTMTTLNHGHDYFALIVKGDSMDLAGIPDGSEVVVRVQPTVENGQIAAVLIGDSATVKKFYLHDYKVFLNPVSSNPAHNVQIYDVRETEVRILGLVMEVGYRIN